MTAEQLEKRYTAQCRPHLRRYLQAKKKLLEEYNRVTEPFKLERDLGLLMKETK